MLIPLVIRSSSFALVSVRGLRPSLFALVNATGPCSSPFALVSAQGRVHSVIMLHGSFLFDDCSWCKNSKREAGMNIPASRLLFFYFLHLVGFLPTSKNLIIIMITITITIIIIILICDVRCSLTVHMEKATRTGIATT